ncbi:MAG: protein translocase subunit SecF [Magnetococcales bacterium]|nr:protein translocase subunit SecF [Magnetococcales bacterium]
MESSVKRTHIDFVGFRYVAFALSIATLLISLVSFVLQGFNFGIDFAGGLAVQLRFQQPPDLVQVRGQLANLHLGDLVIQEMGGGNEILIRVKQKEEAAAGQSVGMVRHIVEALKPAANGQEIEVRSSEYVGPQVGRELVQQALLAILYSWIGILAYVSWRFELRFALGAVLALIHDVLVAIGILTLFQREITMVVLAALLTIIGYSINDTIVVFDRIREEQKRLKQQPMAVIINEAINATLSRTMITVLTVVIALVALLLFGGSVLFDFSMTLLVGIISGTFSSVYVAAPLVLVMERKNPTAASVDP